MGIARVPTPRWGSRQSPDWEVLEEMLVSSVWDEIVFILAICISGCSPWIIAWAL